MPKSNQRPNGFTKRDLVDYLLELSTENGGCMDCHQNPQPKGYCRVGFEGKMVTAHRLVWEVENGMQVPDGLVVRHKCDNPRCINPSHLIVGTHADNMRDRNERGRQAHLRGEANGCAKLTEIDVARIRKMHADEGHTYGDIAGQFGVTAAAVGSIVRRTNWKHVH